jgi:hypothetical protein
MVSEDPNPTQWYPTACGFDIVQLFFFPEYPSELRDSIEIVRNLLKLKL